MGGGVSALHVNDDKNDPNYGIGYAKSMFTLKEWNTLKLFSNNYNILQTDLNRLTIKFLSSSEALLRNMRVNPNDLKLLFSTQNLVLQECADIFIPQIFLKDDKRLNPPYSIEEISFTRFTILGYIFCAQPIQDLFYDFFAITKRNYDIQIISSIYTFNLYQIIKLLTENFQISSTLSYILKKCNIKNDTEITLDDVMHLGVKYPLMFYSLVQFRKCFKRKFFGDKFWKNRETLESRFFNSFDYYDPSVFDSYDLALQTTSRAIIFDFIKITPYSLVTELYVNQKEIFEDNTAKDYIIPSDVIHRMKSELGYRDARQIIIESGLKYSESEIIFMNLPIPSDHENYENERIYDPKIKATFIVNYGSGLRAWVDKYCARDGTVLREEYFRIDNSHFINNTSKITNLMYEQSLLSDTLTSYDESQLSEYSGDEFGKQQKRRKSTINKKRARRNSTLTNNSNQVVAGKMELPI